MTIPAANPDPANPTRPPSDSPGPRYRDISAERRAEAAACVERHLDQLGALLAESGLPCRVVEGSAVAAEVFLTETNTLHTAVRVAVTVAPGDRASYARALTRAGFDATEPAGDGTILRLAARSGRRAIHVLFEGDGDGPRAGAHPGSPLAARARAERLRRAFAEIDAAFRRVVLTTRADHDVTESFEVQLIDEGTATIRTGAS